MKKQKVKLTEDEIEFTPADEEPYKYVLCIWEDAYCFTDSAWHAGEELNIEPLLVTTAGMLIKETDDQLILAVGMYREGDVVSAMCASLIPKSCIRKIEVFEHALGKSKKTGKRPLQNRRR